MSNTPTIEEARTWLGRSVHLRPRPEEVAYYMAHAGLNVGLGTKQAIAHVSKRSSDAMRSWMSSQWRDVSSAAGILASIEKDVAASGWTNLDDVADPRDWREVQHYARQVAQKLHVDLSGLPGSIPNRAEIRSSVGIPQRRFNRLVRALRALNDKARRMRFEQDVRDMAQLGRGGAATQIPADVWHHYPETGALISYVVAKRNVRRQFTLDGKDSILDEVLSSLLDDLLSPYKKGARRPESRVADDIDETLGVTSKRYEAPGYVPWARVAAVWPDPSILERLDGVQLGTLVAQSFATMRRAAEFLDRIHAGFLSPLDQVDYIVAAGQDSDSWNLAAQAYNEARTAWLRALDQVGMKDAVLEEFCPPKAMRLMAYDLARWGRMYGTFPHPSQFVAKHLPLPTDVVLGRVPCTRIEVEHAVRDARTELENLGRLADVTKLEGWVTPLPEAGFARFKPTPELVHGVVITDPFFAHLLRKAGVFSGQQVDEDLAAAAFEFASPDDLRDILNRGS